MTHTTTKLALAALLAILVTPSAIAEPLTMPADPLNVTPDIASTGTATDPSLTLPPPTETPLGVSSYAGPSGPSSAYSSGSGSVYNPTLGAHIRARYTSESYGQHSGNFDLGTLKLWNANGGVGFFDGQVTFNDTSRVGYNLGLGYRWMTLPLFPNSPDDAKIMGISVWADGQGVDGENFFPQVGTSLEFLGDRVDFRANGYAVVGDSTQTRDFLPTGERGFSGNNVAQLTTGTLDTALTVGEVEFAGRLMDLDAWLFGGVYSYAGEGVSEVGGKVGLRGYASPDLALSIAITHDELFETNAVFGATWFIGRTRRENCPCGTLYDRMREPVIRNNYVAIARSRVSGIGEIATDTNGDAFRVVHVDSTAAAGGDGTFESPLNTLDDINGNSMEGDIVLAHADSVFTGQSAALLNDQTFVGEGGGNTFPITTTEFGVIDLPETATGALNGAIPSINASPAAGVTVALNNTVQNLAFDGGVNAIINSATGSENATLRNLTIANTTGNAISLTTVDGADTEDLDGDSDTTEILNLLGNVVIDEVTFTGVAGADIAIDGATAAATNRGETINITNVTSSTNTGVASIDIRNTNGTTGDVVNIDSYTFNGTGANGALAFDSNEGNINVTNSTITGGAGPGVNVTNTNGVTSTATISVGSTVDITDVADTAVNVNGNTGQVTVNAVISTTGAASGGNVIVTDNEGVVSFGGNITTNNVNSVTLTNAQANVNFSGDIDSQGTGNAITIADAGTNTTNNAEVTFSGNLTNAQGSSVVITGGDDSITFLQDITDDGAGIQVSGRLAGTVADPSQVLFGGQTTLNTTTSTAVALTGNDDTSIVDFTELDITTTSGTGIFANNGGELNVTGTDSTITTTTGQALNITGGSSTNGVTFATVDTNGAANAIDLNDFDGTVTVNGGTLTTTGEAVTIEDSVLVLNDVDIDSTSDEAIGATFTDSTARTLTVTNMDANGGDFDFVSSGFAGATVALSDITEGGAVSFLASGDGDNSLTLTDVETDDGFDYDVTDDGDLTVSMTNVTGAGNTTLDVSSNGNGQLTMNNVNTGAAIAANSTVGSTGDLTVSVLNSGNTTAFTGITVNDQGDGIANASFSNTTSTSGVDFDSTGTGAATLIVVGGEYGGEINANATNTGNFTADVIGNTELTAGGIVVTAANTGAFSSNLNGVDTQEGVTINSTNVGASTMTINGGSYGDAFDIDANNTGTLSFTMQNVAFSTGNNNTAVSLLVGTGVSTGGINISNNTGITTGDARALDLDFNGGDIDFLLNNNTFTNNSATDNTAVIDVAGTTNLDATVTNNTLTNSNGAGPAQLVIRTSANNPTIGLNLSANTVNSGGGNANGEIFIQEALGTTFGVFELSDTFTNVGRNNAAAVTFDPNLEADFDDLAVPPALP